MQGVFLHILSDALGSVIVIVTALVCWLIPGQEILKLYLDPTLRFFYPLYHFSWLYNRQTSVLFTTSRNIINNCSHAWIRKNF